MGGVRLTFTYISFHPCILNLRSCPRMQLKGRNKDNLFILHNIEFFEVVIA